MASAVQPIRGIQGRVIQAGEAEYERARRVSNAMIDRRPALIVKVAGQEDVVRAIDYARRHGLPLSIRGGGHNVAGNSVAEGGVVIDHSDLRGVRVNARAGFADVQPGARWFDVDRAAQEHELGTTGGLISDTGVAGLTLGGGIGWLVRRFGLASDNLLEADLVTAGGERLTASETEHPDLLWALRGGGGNFGVVTRFRLRMHAVGNVTGGFIVHPGERAGEVLRLWRDLVPQAPPELTYLVVLGTSADGQPTVTIGYCHSGDPAAAERDLAPLRGFRPAGLERGQVMPYAAMQVLLDQVRRDRGAVDTRAYWKADFMADLPDAAVDALVDAASRMRSPLTQVHLHNLGGAMAAEPTGGSAFPSRSAGFVYNLVAEWKDSAEDPIHVEWARQEFENLRPYSLGGAYINFLGDDGDTRVRAAYGSNYERLAVLKRRYDPGNVFRLNQNIRPA